MDHHPLLARFSVATALLLLAAGCAGASVAPQSNTAAAAGAGQLGMTPHVVPQRAAAGAAAHPAVCIPNVWASSLSANAVYGYTAPSSAPCVTLSGPYNGVSFNAPISLATDRHGHLYVADLNNFRIAVFTRTGVFIKAFNTTLGTQSYQPWGVCVSNNGVVGVGNRQFNNSGPPGNVEFFPSSAPNNSTPTGWANGILSSEEFCAFDKRGNFFVDGVAAASPGGQKIAYLSRANVNLPSGTLVDSNLGSASFWVGMYSRIDNPVDDTLSVGTSVGNSSTETVMNWKIAGPPAGPLTFSSLPAYTLSSYPVTTDAVYQLAPFVKTFLYIADYGNSTVLQAPSNGGGVTPYNSVGGTVGVATYPRGQY
jgi:hypothetical protein